MSQTSCLRPALAASAFMLLMSGTAIAVVPSPGGAPAPAQDVRQFACPPDRVPDAGFTDIAASTFQLEINCLAGYGITTGVTADTFAPTGLVSRGQMAQFIARVATDHAGLQLDPADAGFADLGTLSPAARDAINGLANAGIVNGTSPTTYGPAGPVKRDQMASFLARLQEQAGTSFLPGEDAFTDDQDNPHEDNINRIAAVGIVNGTGERSYTPAGQVSRQQMSAFLMRYLADRIDTSEIRSRYPLAAPARVTLGAETTITGTSSGKIPVRLDQPATLDRPRHQKAGGVRISGDGRFVGFALVADGTDPHRVMISGGQVDNGLGEMPVMTANHSFAEIGTTEDGDWILPAGDYHLYLIADGSLASVTLLLDGPTGTQQLAPAVPVASHAARPAARLSPQGVQTGGALSELRGGEGLLLQLYATVNTASAFSSVTKCIYRGEAALTASHAPGCPGAEHRGAPIVLEPYAGRGLSTGSFAAYYKLSSYFPFAQGYSYTNAGVNEHLDYTAMWLTL